MTSFELAHGVLENPGVTLYGCRVRQFFHHRPALALVVLATYLLPMSAARAQTEPEAVEEATVAPIVAYFDYKRIGSPAFTVEVPTDWVPITGDRLHHARLEYVANLREVLDAPPDVPPGAFDRLLSFAAYWIPEIDGYLLATVFDANVYPVQLFDVLHLHAMGSNDWGKSLYIRVEQVHRNDRYAIGHNPALAIDVEMSSQLMITARYFQIPSPFHRIGGIVLLLPNDNWSALSPLVERIATSIRVGSSNEDPQPIADDFRPAEAGDATGVRRGVPQSDGEISTGVRRKWNPIPAGEQQGSSGVAVLSGLIVIAVAYPLIFFLTLRVIYFLILLIGSVASSAIDIEVYRKAAEANPWTMGLLRSERMIMVTAIASMILAALLLGAILQQF